MPTPTSRRLALALAVPLALATFAGCSSDDSATDTGDTGPTVDASTSETPQDGGATKGGEASAEGIEVTGAWARTSPAMAEAGAAYMTVTSEEANALVGASVPASVAGTVELHETTMAEDSSTSMDMGSASTTTSAMGGMDSGTGDTMGEMTMVPVDSIELPAGKAVELKPGGYHIMLLDLAAPLEVGSTIEVTLTFESGDPLKVSVPVLDEAPEA